MRRLIPLTVNALLVTTALVGCGHTAKPCLPMAAGRLVVTVDTGTGDDGPQPLPLAPLRPTPVVSPTGHVTC